MFNSDTKKYLGNFVTADDIHVERENPTEEKLRLDKEKLALLKVVVNFLVAR